MENITPVSAASILEQMIDRLTLQTVVQLLANICDDKAEHICSNWQDSTLAEKWLNAGSKLSVTAAHIARHCI